MWTVFKNKKLVQMLLLKIYMCYYYKNIFNALNNKGKLAVRALMF